MSVNSYEILEKFKIYLEKLSSNYSSPTGKASSYIRALEIWSNFCQLNLNKSNIELIIKKWKEFKSLYNKNNLDKWNNSYFKKGFINAAINQLQNWYYLISDYSEDISVLPTKDIELLIKSIKTIHRNQSNVSIPITTTKEVKSYVRDFKVSILCKQNANGKCACCKKIIGKDMLLNIPELQCHHIVPLCNGGSDSIENCEALCPNCHRWKHKILRIEDSAEEEKE